MSQLVPNVFKSVQLRSCRCMHFRTKMCAQTQKVIINKKKEAEHTNNRQLQKISQKLSPFYFASRHKLESPCSASIQHLNSTIGKYYSVAFIRT